jgi:Lrp/AsnC ligand binding domain
MSITAWVLVQTDIGHARRVRDALAAIDVAGVTVLVADTVTGPHDIILQVEAESLELLSDVTDNAVVAAGGVQNVITCLAIH